MSAKGPIADIKTCRKKSPFQTLRRLAPLWACAHETPRHRARVLAPLEDWNACGKRRFISVDTLHETPAASRHVMDKLRLMQPQTVEVDYIYIGAQARHQPTAIRQTEEVGGFTRLPLD